MSNALSYYVFPMSNAWSYYVIPLFVSIVMVSVDIALLRYLQRGDHDGKGKKPSRVARCFLALHMLFGGTLGLATLLFSPTPWSRQNLFDHVFRTPPERIERYVIYPDRHHSLTQSQVVIDDSARIRRIAEILRRAHEVSPNHPRTRWTATVEMVTQDGAYYFQVCGTVPGDVNGTLVRAQTTKEGGGWNLGAVRANGLDQILEEAVAAANARLRPAQK
jgi:hypothetical protein